MRQTALGALVAGIGWMAVLLGFLAASLPLAFVGVAFVAAHEAARRHVRHVPVQVRRDHPASVQMGASFTIETRAAAQERLPLWVEDDVDVPLHATFRASRPGRGHAAHRMQVVAHEAGTARWRTVSVRVADPWALWEQERQVPLRTTLAVSPEAEWVAQGRATGRRHTVETLRRGRLDFESLPEVTGVRDFLPGDRLRDIDWARSSRTRSLHTRLRQRMDPRPVIVLLDATAPMRMHRRRAKITSGARLAYAVVAAAQAAGVQGRVVAYDERGAMSMGQGRLSTAAQRLGQLDAPIPVAQVPTQPSGTLRSQRGFLGALAAMAPGIASAPPLEAALGQVAQHRGQAFVVAIVDGESDPEAAFFVAARLRAAGHDVGMVLPATGAHHHRRAEARGRILDDLKEFQARRVALRRRLAALQVPMAILRPDNVEAVLEEVAQWTQ